ARSPWCIAGAGGEPAENGRRAWQSGLDHLLAGASSVGEHSARPAVRNLPDIWTNTPRCHVGQFSQIVPPGSYGESGLFESSFLGDRIRPVSGQCAVRPGVADLAET